MTMTTMFVAMITPMTVSKVCDSTHSAMAILAGPRTYRANSAPGTAPDHVAVLIQPGLRLARLVAQRVLLLGASSQKLSGATYTASKGPSKTTSHRRVTPFRAPKRSPRLDRRERSLQMRLLLHTLLVLRDGGVQLRVGAAASEATAPLDSSAPG